MDYATLIETWSAVNDIEHEVIRYIFKTKLEKLENLELHTKIGKHQFKYHDVCDKSYLTQDRLDRHMEVHIGLQHCAQIVGNLITRSRHINAMYLNKSFYYKPTINTADSTPLFHYQIRPERFHY